MDCWENLLDKEYLKASIEFSSLFVMFFESLKDFIINQPKTFYCSISENGDLNVDFQETEKYKQEVRSLDGHIDNASLKWFLKFQAITQEDINEYQIMRKRRNEFAHELLKNIIDGLTEEDIQLFVKLINLYHKIEKWWITEIEIPICGEDYPQNYDIEGVHEFHSYELILITNILFRTDSEKYQRILEELKNIYYQ